MTVELEALVRLTGVEHAQLINDLKATGFEVGLLLNFGAPSLEHKRFVHSKRSAELTDWADHKDRDC
ncbi:MAG: GxxExxY protein [Terriglobia bacterium]